MSASYPSWPRTGAGNRQSVADIGQVIFEIAVFVVLRVERYAADLAVAGGEAAAGGAHAAPFRAINRHRVHNAECGRQHFGADPFAGALHMAGRAGEVELAAAGIKIFLAVLVGLERAWVVRDVDGE